MGVSESPRMHLRALEIKFWREVADPHRIYRSEHISFQYSLHFFLPPIPLYCSRLELLSLLVLILLVALNFSNLQAHFYRLNSARYISAPTYVLL